MHSGAQSADCYYLAALGPTTGGVNILYRTRVLVCLDAVLVKVLHQQKSGASWASGGHIISNMCVLGSLYTQACLIPTGINNGQREICTQGRKLEALSVKVTYRITRLPTIDGSYTPHSRRQKGETEREDGHYPTFHKGISSLNRPIIVLKS